MALLHAYPVARNWISSADLIDRVQRKLAERVKVQVWDPSLMYTGSLLLEALLGETFTNGKLVADVLVAKDEFHFEEIHLRNKSYYKRCTRVYNDIHDDEGKACCFRYDLYGESPKDFVAEFDFDCCMNFVSNSCLYIKRPEAIIKRRTGVNIASYFEPDYYNDNKGLELAELRHEIYAGRGWTFYLRPSLSKTSNPRGIYETVHGQVVIGTVINQGELKKPKTETVFIDRHRNSKDNLAWIRRMEKILETYYTDWRSEFA